MCGDENEKTGLGLWARFTRWYRAGSFWRRCACWVTAAEAAYITACLMSSVQHISWPMLVAVWLLLDIAFYAADMLCLEHIDRGLSDLAENERRCEIDRLPDEECRRLGELYWQAFFSFMANQDTRRRLERWWLHGDDERVVLYRHPQYQVTIGLAEYQQHEIDITMPGCFRWTVNAAALMSQGGHAWMLVFQKLKLPLAELRNPPTVDDIVRTVWPPDEVVVPPTALSRAVADNEPTAGLSLAPEPPAYDEQPRDRGDAVAEEGSQVLDRCAQ